ncbi:MAG: NAD regulator [Pseudomonadota bacterium]
MSASLQIGLSAVIVAVDGDQPLALLTRRSDGELALPFGPFDPEGHRTFELGLRGWVRQQTGFQLGYVEQLYTFGDLGRETPRARASADSGDPRVISVGYLALTPAAAEIDTSFDAHWGGWYSLFPWEDHRRGRPGLIDLEIAPRLISWAAGNAARLDRARVAFGLDGQAWVEEWVLERYELLYEAGLVAECARDAGLPTDGVQVGISMASDHRRILATAMGRLRGKMKYRPVVFEMMAETFTLSALQASAEAILGLSLHKQNFRRSLDKTGLTEGTGITEPSTGGRPAELFRFKRELLRQKAVRGISTPLRRDG